MGQGGGHGGGSRVANMADGRPNLVNKANMVSMVNGGIIGSFNRKLVHKITLPSYTEQHTYLLARQLPKCFTTKLRPKTTDGNATTAQTAERKNLAQTRDCTDNGSAHCWSTCLK